MDFIRSKKSGLSLDMAPLIDVVFQLLIFFMLSSSFMSPALKLELPKAVSKDEIQDEKVVVSVDKAGEIFVNTERVPMEALKGKLESKFAAGEDKSVHLRGDAAMPYRLFVEVMDTARQAGARQINIVHESKDVPSTS